MYIVQNVNEQKETNVNEQKETNAQRQQRIRDAQKASIGRRIRKKFSNKWYSGIINYWDGENKLYHVKYDDGDSEDLDHDEMHECLLHHEQNEDKKEAHVKRQQRFRDAKKASVRTNTFVIIMIATCLIMYIVQNVSINERPLTNAQSDQLRINAVKAKQRRTSVRSAHPFFRLHSHHTPTLSYKANEERC